MANLGFLYMNLDQDIDSEGSHLVYGEYEFLAGSEIPHSQ